MSYKYGTYGYLADSVVSATDVSSTAAVYFGTAPVNLVRNYASAGLVNNPIRLESYTDAKEKVGISADWKTFTLSQAVEAHFNNQNGNVGPIYVINVLNPTTDRKAEATTKSLTFVNGKASFASDKIILDTFAIADKAEGKDYNLSYNFITGKVMITSANDEDILTGTLTVSYFEIDASGIDIDTIIGTATAGGVYTGIQAAALIYQKFNVIPNLFAAPGWSQYPDVYKALIQIATKLNGHWDGFVYADVPLAYDSFQAIETPGNKNPKAEGWYELVDGTYVLSGDTTATEGKTYFEKVSVAVDTIDKANEWKTNNGYTSERSKAFWPETVGTDNNVYNLSTLAVVETLRVDNSHSGVPFETCGNKTVAVQKQYFGEDSANQGFDIEAGNKLCANGISTIVYWAGAWRLWGDSTAAYVFEDEGVDLRDYFDVTMRMLFHLTNRFQRVWFTTIDKPFTISVRDTIIVREQQYLDSLVATGALIGSPTITFDETLNTLTEVRAGNFYFNIAVTPTPPFHSATAYVAYTDEGFSAYFE